MKKPPLLESLSALPFHDHLVDRNGVTVVGAPVTTPAVAQQPAPYRRRFLQHYFAATTIHTQEISKVGEHFRRRKSRHHQPRVSTEEETKENALLTLPVD
jgi:hypothetical protein